MWNYSICQVKLVAKRGFLRVLEKNFLLTTVMQTLLLLYNTISVVLVS